MSATRLAKPRVRFRLTEFSLLVLPSLLVLTGMATLLAYQGRPITRETLLSGLALIVLVLIAHWAWSLAGLGGDQILFPVAVALVGIGLTAIQRIALDNVELQALPSRQAIWAGLGLAAMVLTALVVKDPPRLRRYKYTSLAAAVSLVLLTFALGRDVNDSGARLWVGFGPVQFQPTEIVKVLLVVFFAGYLEEHRELLARGVYRLGPLSLPPLPYLLPIVLMWGLSLLLFVVQRDLGAALILFGVFLAMLYAASGRALYVWTALFAFVGAAALLYRLFPVVRVRAEVWLDPWSQAGDKGYQIIQALIALASGGLIGSGLGYGQPGYVPAVHTDFVLVALGEELGLLGTLGVVGLYVVLALRAYRVALLARGAFNQLLACGLATTLAWQSIVILGGSLKLIPLTGVTLPFISYGGSSLVANFIIIGLLVRLSNKD